MFSEEQQEHFLRAANSVEWVLSTGQKFSLWGCQNKYFILVFTVQDNTIWIGNTISCINTGERLVSIRKMILNWKINPKEVQIFLSLKSTGKLALISVWLESALCFNRNLLVMAKFMFEYLCQINFLLISLSYCSICFPLTCSSVVPFSHWPLLPS